jgi:hypothetical protein
MLFPTVRRMVRVLVLGSVLIAMNASLAFSCGAQHKCTECSCDANCNCVCIQIC